MCPVDIRELRAGGLDYLALATQLLQRARVTDPDAGVWEAADLQWWWRRPRRSDAIEQLFWLDDTGPVAAVVLTDWGSSWGCDLIVAPERAASIDDVWRAALDRVELLGLETVAVLARDDDVALVDLLVRTGFAATDNRSAIASLAAAERPAVMPPPDGFALVDRTRTDRPHPMRRRSGDHVEERLRQCSLYDPELDLAAEASDGEVAAYALFWFDPVTEVGLVEPMRVEDAYQRRGLARVLLTEGLERLARRGARRLKVGYANEAARALYTSVGFRTTATLTSYVQRRAGVATS